MREVTRPQKDHPRRDARLWRSRPADLLRQLPVLVLDQDQRRSVAGSRPRLSDIEDSRAGT